MTDPITHANTLAEIDDLKARIASVERERDECDALRERMADLLTRTTNALKGEPAELELHSWHDLPDVAVAIRSRIDALESRNAALVKAARMGHSALDRLMGDSDLSEDDSYEMQACQALAAALAAAEAAVDNTKGPTND